MSKESMEHGVVVEPIPRGRLGRVLGRTAAAAGLVLGVGAIADHTYEGGDVVEASDTYPDSDATDCSATYGTYSWCKDAGGYALYGSSRGYAYRNCTDWAAWRVKELTGVSVPWGLGNAISWDDNATGYEVDQSPEVGDVAVWNTGAYGHVEVVESVNADGTVNTSGYNKSGTGSYGTQLSVTADAYIDFDGPGTGSTPTSPGNQYFAENFDADPQAETVVVIDDMVHVRDQDGSILGSFRYGNGIANGNQYFAADYDGDGIANIAVAINDVVHVRDEDGSLLGAFQYGNGTVNDNQYFAGNFDADPQAETVVVINDMVHIRDQDGSILESFQYGNGIANGNQYFAADYDGNGKANIAVAINDVVHVRDDDGSLLGSFQYGNGTAAGNLYFAASYDTDPQAETVVVIDDMVHVRDQDGSILGSFQYGNGV